MTASPLTFGIYPLGVAGTPTGLAVGPPDDYDRIRAALDDLRLNGSARTYLVDTDSGGEDAVFRLADRYGAAGLLDHVTLGCWRDTGFQLARWTQLVRTVVNRYGDRLRSLQITNEPNLSFMDGAKPYVLEALTHGVIAAKDEIRRRGLGIDVGFGSVPHSPVALPGFWADWPTGTNPLTGTTRITHYMLFGLRDGDSSRPDLFHQFGITRDNYRPKPGYQAFKALRGELGS